METLLQTSTDLFLQGGGEMGKLTRGFDWSETAVGSSAAWPQSLRTTVSDLLRSKFPMFLWRGEEMIQFYNDAYRPSLGNEGKHSTALGQKGKECWPEIWPVIHPLIQGVKATGEATWLEDQLIPIYRNGVLEDVYWTFSYSLVLNDGGEFGGVLVTCMETTKAVTAQRRIENSEQSLRNSILQAPFAICIFRGPAFVIEVANESMFQLWGRSSEEVTGKPLFEALPEAAAQGYEELMSSVLKTGELFSATELPVMLPRNGVVQTVFINFSYQPLRETDGSISGIMATATDVTEQVMARRKIEDVVAQRTEELAMANESLSALNKELSRSNAHLEEFAHAASHDLKEPVRKISFFMQQLKNQLADRVKENEKYSFGRVENATERMGNLIDDLLLYSHVSQRPHEMERVDLNVNVKRVLEDLELDIAEKKATIQVGKLPVVEGHRRQLQQLFQNLISNALKYSKADAPLYINITAEAAEGEGTNYNVINVQDNGIGFDHEYADKIFQMFVRLHGKNEYSGTGIGLSIVKKVIENHNGFIRVESAIGEGSVFKSTYRLAAVEKRPVRNRTFS